MENNEDIMSAMYAQEDTDDYEDDAKQPQPEQLRLAGKATLITHSDKQIAIPRIEYVEALEKTLNEQKRLLDELKAKLKRQEIMMNRLMNNANRRIIQLEGSVDGLSNKNRWD